MTPQVVAAVEPYGLMLDWERRASLAKSEGQRRAFRAIAAGFRAEARAACESAGELGGAERAIVDGILRDIEGGGE